MAAELLTVPETGAFGPALWQCGSADNTSFHSFFISGATRLPNGNTLICEGDDGRFFEITEEGEIVREYWSPYSVNARMADGSTPQPVMGFTYAVFRATKPPTEHPAFLGGGSDHSIRSRPRWCTKRKRAAARSHSGETRRRR